MLYHPIQTDLTADRPDRLHSLVGTMNRRLCAAYLINFVAQSVVPLLGFTTWNADKVLDAWLRDSAACTHTDLIYFGRNEKARVLYFSPFQTRPLGKNLPNLFDSCQCRDHNVESPNRGKKKVWKVLHNGVHNRKLSEIVITISCSLCKTKWSLHQPNLPGKLHKVAGLFAAEVPYFYDPTVASDLIA